MAPNDSTLSRPAYKVEELLALRSSASESRVSLEKFPDEDVIKDHVLRRSPSGAFVVSTENVQPPPTACDGSTHPTLYQAATYRHRMQQTEPRNCNHAVVTNVPTSVFTNPNNVVKRSSPTPSIKRTKVERLIKEHGSPPNVRVTAGGRIVPNDLPQLGSPLQPPRIAGNGFQRMPNVMPHGLTGSGTGVISPQLQPGYLAYNQSGQLVQWIDGRWNEVLSDARGQPVYSMPPSNLPFVSANSFFNIGAMPRMVAQPPHPGMALMQQYGSHDATEDIPAQIGIYQDQYERTRRDKIELERHEVKTADTLTAAQRAQIVDQKRKYVLMLDTIRRKIKELEGHRNGDLPPFSAIGYVPNIPYSYDGASGTNSAFTGMLGAHYGAGSIQSMQAVGGYSAPHGIFQGSHGYGGGSEPSAGTATIVAGPSAITQQPEAAVSSPTSEISPSARGNTRRSYAVPIKDPNTAQSEAGTGEHASNLNPASPSYEPGKAFQTRPQTTTVSTEVSTEAPFPLSEASPPQFVVPAPTPIETPNPPPAELAKHWVFSQEGTMKESNFNATYTTAITRTKFTRAEGRENTNLGTDKGEHVFGQRTSNEEDIDHSSQNQTNHSSVTTTDFFPVDTHEHSFNKYMSRKASAAARLSAENNQLMPMRDPYDEVTSPVTDHGHPPCPPVSPIGLEASPSLLATSPEDMRVSSFLRDATRTPMFNRGDEEGQATRYSPVLAETRSEFQGKSKSYLEGYLAGSSGQAPMDPKNQEYCGGYIAGLSRNCFNGTAGESSAVSLRSEAISISRTPPNTTDNGSLVAEITSTQPTRRENLRLTQSMQHFSSPARSLPEASNPSLGYPDGNGIGGGGGSGSDSHGTTSSFHHEKFTSFAPSGFNLMSQTHFPRSWSEDKAALAGPRATSPQSESAFISARVWNANTATHQPKLIHSKDITHASPKTAIASSTVFSVNRHTDRLVTASLTSQPSLTGYSGNQPEARVGSIPQTSVFGDDKYVLTSTTKSAHKMKGVITKSSDASGRGSHYDGALDDFAELAGSLAPSTTLDPSKPEKTASKTGSSPSPHGHLPMPGSNGKTPGPETTPPASPSKSTPSPKKVTSPRHRMQQFATRVGDKVGEIFDRGNNCTGGDRESRGETSRGDSPDPAKMGPEEKRRWKDGWRSKFHAAKMREDNEYRKWRKDQTLQ